MKYNRFLIPSIPILLMLIALLNMPLLNAQEAEEEYQDALVTLSFLEEDDSKIIRATARDMEGNPITDLELYFYVQRTFSLLPIGDFINFTDENGMVEVEFPGDLPGDKEGHVKIIVKLQDSDSYNDLTVERIKNWGIPTPVDQFEEKRSLWAAAANAPIALVLATSGMILAVWSIIGYIIFILFKISKLNKVNT
ncbi:hypothetical protein [Lentiprolixibacter aurantiacus]|uniref:Uncharacterized protein n=1 Tax=Lentiprolixibacter aurantiacus TaxID=2993939 RepID=A0AAE3MN41_9FLAO|nr:hypothetical protein [Lentiprolixibacter aurantiacus]MCX2720381.1 hypothetical protein [Lentiprolixibacter aurantiacus]